MWRASPRETSARESRAARATRFIPGQVAGVLVAKSLAAREVVTHKISREVDGALCFVGGLPDAERQNASVIEHSNFVPHQASLRFEYGHQPGRSDLEHLIGSAGYHVEERNSEMAHVDPLSSLGRCSHRRAT